MIKRNAITVILIWIFILQIQSQVNNFDPIGKIIPPSSTPASIVKFVDMPVSYYSGVPQINIPIHEIKIGSFTFPISLSYHAGGVRLSEMASWIGLGWTLNAGGAVTRTIVGDVDEGGYKIGYSQLNETYPFGVPPGMKGEIYYFNGNKQMPMVTTDDVTFNSKVSEGWDSEPDNFYFNTGISSGSFKFNTFGEIINSPDQKVKIEKGSNFQSFKIKDINGTVYLFDIIEELATTSHSSDAWPYENVGFSNIPPTLIPNKSTWYLSQITFPDNDQVIKFFYQSISSPKYINPGTAKFYSQPINGKSAQTSISYNEIPSQKILSAIEWNTGKITFEIGNERLDYSESPFLKQIHIFEKRNTGYIELRKYKFNYNYMHYNGMLAENTPKTWVANFKEDAKYRLILAGIDEIESKLNKSDKKYSFKYFLDPSGHGLPSRLSSQSDLMGFYNGKGIYDTGYDFDKAIVGTLSEINYPTGGSTKYFFEPHSIEMGKAGIRIKKIITFDPLNNKSLTKLFEYSNYEWNVNYQKYAPYPETHLTMGGQQSAIVSLRNPYVPLSSSKGIISGYRNIRVYETDNPETNDFADKSKFKGVTFLEYSSAMDEQSIMFANPPSQEPAFGTNTYNTVSFPYCPVVSTGWKRGLLLSETYYDKDSKLIKKIENEYNFIHNDDTIYCLRSAPYCYNLEGKPGFFSRFYAQCSGYSLLKQTKITEYMGNGSSMTQTDNYEYDNKCQLKSEIKDNSQGDLTKLVYSYPYDYDNSELNDNVSHGINKLIINNQLSQIVETQKLQKKQNETTYSFIGGSLNLFTLNGSNEQFPKLSKHLTYIIKSANSEYIPAKISGGYFIYKAGNSQNEGYIPISNFDKYDDHGNLLQVHNENDRNFSIIWAYNNSLPVIKAENIDYNTLISKITLSLSNTGFTNINDLVQSINYFPNSTWNAFNKNLRQNVEDNVFINSFTYSPLIGMTSQTDPNGITTYYDYDSFGRLKFIRDNDGNILKSYEYHYKE